MGSEAFTVGDLRRALQAYADDDKLLFDGGVTFSHIKAWGEDALIIFAQPQAELLPTTRERILVAFAHFDPEDPAATFFVPTI